MTDQFTRETNRFLVGDETGEETVFEFTTFYRTNPVRQEPVTLAGPKHYELSDGSPVNLLKDGTFEVVGTDRILRQV